MTIGQRIKQRRKELKLTLKDIQTQSGLTISTLSDIENDKYPPSVGAIISLTELLKVSSDWIIFGRISPTQKDDYDYSEKILSESELICEFSKLSDKDKLEIVDMINIKNSRAEKLIKLSLKKQENIVDKTNKDRIIFFE